MLSEKRARSQVVVLSFLTFSRNLKRAQIGLGFGSPRWRLEQGREAFGAPLDKKEGSLFRPRAEFDHF